MPAGYTSLQDVIDVLSAAQLEEYVRGTESLEAFLATTSEGARMTMTDTPAHVHARIAEHVNRGLTAKEQIDVDDVEFVIDYVSSGGSLRAADEILRFYSIDTGLRLEIVSEAREYGLGLGPEDRA